MGPVCAATSCMMGCGMMLHRGALQKMLGRLQGNRSCHAAAALRVISECLRVQV